MNLSAGARAFLLSAILAGILLATAASALWLARTHLGDVETAHQEAQRERSAAGMRYQQMRAEEQSIRRAVARYQALQREGVAGPEHRLDWIEQLGVLRTRQHLPNLQFELAPQRAPLAELPTLRASSMRLQAQFPHEESLLALIATLRRSAGVRVLPRQCQLERQAPGESTVGVKASCELDWITLGARQNNKP